MNNIQLALFLEKYMILLSKAIEEVKQELPQEAVVERQNILGWKTENFPILDPLYAVLNSLDDDIELLKRNSNDSGNHDVRT